ncbi:hypothetical protein GCM10009540_93650 [Streptomyces turgidiscabies]
MTGEEEVAGVQQGRVGGDEPDAGAEGPPVGDGRGADGGGHHDAPEVESAEPEEDVRSSEEDWRPLDVESEESVESEDVEDELSDVDDVDDVSVVVSVLVSVLLLELDVESEVELALALASDSIVPTRANTPAAAASETAAATAAVRRIPLRTAAAAPRTRSLTVMAVPLRRT